MHRTLRPLKAPKLSLEWSLLLALCVILLLAGGASRADISGQPVVRAVSGVALAVLILFGRRIEIGVARPPLALLLAAIALPLAQLVPLPPSLWQSLPMRTIFEQALTGEQPWRPLSIVPDATINAAGSLLVPLAVLLLLAALRPEERDRLPGLLLSLVVGSMLIGVLQLSGSGLDNPFINESAGQVSGSFANRNHFAVFMAIGCLLTPLWPFAGHRHPRWRGPVAFVLLILFLLVILASGSRAGMLVGGFALVLGLWLARNELRRSFRSAPRWVPPALLTGVILTLVAFVFVSVSADRAESISRTVSLDATGDIRARALPTVISSVQSYFPAGSGFGSFDPVFRIHEPFDLLRPTYLNHAHNDFLEIVMEGGLPGLLLLLAGVIWWLVASVRVFRHSSGREALLGRLGSSMIGLLLIAGIVDYPSRTPMMMATLVIAAVWLCLGQKGGKARHFTEA